MSSETPSHDELAARFAWLEDIVAWSVSVIPGGSPEEVLRIYGGDPQDSAGEHDFWKLALLQGEPWGKMEYYAQVYQHGRYTVVLENNGWSGSHPEIARQCSAGGGHFFSVFWNVNAFGMVTEARNGAITASFEMVHPTAPKAQPHEIRPDWSLAPETDIEMVRETCLAFQERQTGLTFDPAWLELPRTAYRIPEPSELYPDFR